MSLAAPKSAHGQGAVFLQVADAWGMHVTDDDGHEKCVMTAISKAIIFAWVGLWAEGTRLMIY